MFDLSYEGWIHGCKGDKEEKVMLGRGSCVCTAWGCGRVCCVWETESTSVMAELEGNRESDGSCECLVSKQKGHRDIATIKIRLASYSWYKTLSLKLGGKGWQSWVYGVVT